MISLSTLGRGLLGLATVALATGGMGTANTADAANFKGKRITVVIGYGAGGGYDRYGRQVARHIGKHLPGNPSVVAKNRPGAGSFKAVNYIYYKAPKDGTVFGTFARGVPIFAFSGKAKKANFDPLKLTWIGTSSSYKGEAYVMVVRKDTGIHNIADLKKYPKPINLPPHRLALMAPMCPSFCVKFWVSMSSLCAATPVVTRSIWPLIVTKPRPVWWVMPRCGLPIRNG